jgi:hypothetical protein
MEPKKVKDYYKSFVDGAQAITSLTYAFSSLNAMMKTVSDPNVSGWDKFTSIMLSLGTVFPMIVSSLGNINNLLKTSTMV